MAVDLIIFQYSFLQSLTEVKQHCRLWEIKAPVCPKRIQIWDRLVQSVKRDFLQGQSIFRKFSGRTESLHSIFNENFGILALQKTPRLNLNSGLLQYFQSFVVYVGKEVVVYLFTQRLNIIGKLFECPSTMLVWGGET